MIVFTILPFCPSVVYAQLIAEASNWRINGVLVCVWNFIGLVLVAVFYKEPPRTRTMSNKEIARQIDYVGGILSTGGVVCFMMGMQWGAQAVSRIQPLPSLDVLTYIQSSTHGRATTCSFPSSSDLFFSSPSLFGNSCSPSTRWFLRRCSQRRNER